MRVALVNPPTLFPMTAAPSMDAPATPYYELLTADEDRSDRPSTMPGEHLGLAMLASSLRESSHQATIVNGCARFDRSLASTLRAILDSQPDLVGFSGPVEVFGEIRSLARSLRASGFDGPIALGHDFATLNASRILDIAPEIDIVVHGEGERSIVELADALEVSGQCEGVSGVSFRNGSRTVTRPARETLDLSALPKPARDDAPLVIQRGMALAMFTGRGCPYRCSFCTSGSLAGSLGSTNRDYFRRKAPEVAASELIELSETYGCSHVTIVDDLFLTRSQQSREWADRFANVLIDERNRCSFMIDCRVDSLASDILEVLKAAGLSKVFVGVESGSERQRRDLLNKHYGATEVVEAFSTLRRLGIEKVIGFIFFTPTSEISDLVLNIRLLRALSVADYSLFQRLRLYPGTPIIDTLRTSGLLRGEFPYFDADFGDPEVSSVWSDISALLEAHGDTLDRGLAYSNPSDALNQFHRFLDCVEHRIAHPGAEWRDMFDSLLTDLG